LTRNTARISRAALLVVWLIATATAAAGVAFPGQPPDRRIIRIQEKVDTLFEQGSFERALFIYRHELAPLGDKYAQYMVGYMYLAGSGVEEDPVTALAWFGLAAERNQDTFVGARDKLAAVLTEAQREKSNGIYRALRVELGDVSLISRLVEDDLQGLGSGMRLSVSTYGAVGRRGSDREASVKKTVERINARMRYLEECLAQDAARSEAETQAFSDLSARVQRSLADLDANRQAVVRD